MPDAEGPRLEGVGPGDLSPQAENDVDRIRAVLEGADDPAKRAVLSSEVGGWEKDEVLDLRSDLERLAFQPTPGEVAARVPGAASRVLARALVESAMTLRRGGRPEEAIAVHDEVVERFRDSPDPAVRGWVARALIDKALTLGPFEELPPDPVMKELGDAVEPGVAFTYGERDRYRAEIALYDQVIERCGEVAEQCLHPGSLRLHPAA